MPISISWMQQSSNVMIMDIKTIVIWSFIAKFCFLSSFENTNECALCKSKYCFAIFAFTIWKSKAETICLSFGLFSTRDYATGYITYIVWLLSYRLAEHIYVNRNQWQKIFEDNFFCCPKTFLYKLLDNQRNKAFVLEYPREIKTYTMNTLVSFHIYFMVWPLANNMYVHFSSTPHVDWWRYVKWMENGCIWNSAAQCIFNPHTKQTRSNR